MSYTGEHHQIVGKVTLPTQSRGVRKSLDFNIIDGDYLPVFSLNTSIGLGLVSLHNCNVLVLKVDSPSSAPPEDFPDVLRDQAHCQESTTSSSMKTFHPEYMP